MAIFIIGEIGINHNGDIDLAKKLIKAAKKAGADAVKFQERTIELVYTKENLKSFIRFEQNKGLSSKIDRYVRFIANKKAKIELMKLKIL